MITQKFTLDPYGLTRVHKRSADFYGIIKQILLSVIVTVGSYMKSKTNLAHPACAPLLVAVLLVVFGLLNQTGHGLSQRHTGTPLTGASLFAKDAFITRPKPFFTPPLITDYVIPPVTNGLAPVLSTIPTRQNVVFLGIDDGITKQDSELQLLKANNVKASLYLADTHIKDNPNFFRGFIRAGSVVENHSVNHRMMSQLSYAEQRQEICDDSDRQYLQFGRRPVLFRPPYGDYNQDTQRAAAACGIKAVVMWIAKANNGSMQYQVGNSLRPGDIVLMHFRPEFAADMRAFLDAQKAAGLHTVLLENWLQ